MLDDRQQLSRLLELSGVNTVTVAREAGCSDAYVGLMRSGKRRVTPEVLAAARRVALRQIRGTAEVLAGTLNEGEEAGD
jgi:hypothetical protein